MKTVLIYVLSAHTFPYEQMIQTSMQTWDRDYVHGTTTKFYCGYPIINTYRIVSVPVEESYANIGHKNLEAFRRALEWDWDYMARPNASCYVHKERLLAHCQGLPSSGVITGVFAPPTPHCGVTRPWLWGGGQIIFSRDVVEAIVRNGHLWKHHLIEDVAIGELVQDLGFIPDTTLPTCSVNKNPGDWTLISYNGESKSGTFEDIIKDTTHFFFRCKYDPDRTVDREIMYSLKAYL